MSSSLPSVVTSTPSLWRRAPIESERLDGEGQRPTTRLHPQIQSDQDADSNLARIWTPWHHWRISSKIVSQPRLSRVRRESGQFPIIISFLTCQGFLGVLIGLVTNEGARLPFLACCLERPKTCLCRTRPNLCSHLLH